MRKKFQLKQSPGTKLLKQKMGLLLNGIQAQPATLNLAKVPVKPDKENSVTKIKKNETNIPTLELPKEPDDIKDEQSPSCLTSKSQKTIKISMKQVTDPNTSIMTNLIMTPDKKGQIDINHDIRKVNIQNSLNIPEINFVD